MSSVSQNRCRLLELPEEILIFIFLELDLDVVDEDGDYNDEVECRSVCKAFNAALDATVLRYKRLLTYAGKIDVIPPDGVEPCLAARYDALVQYPTAWSQGELSLDERLSNIPNNAFTMSLPCTSSDCVPWTGDAVVVYDEPNLREHIFLPGSTIRRRNEPCEWVIGPEVFRDIEFPLLAVDTTHDLAIGLSRETPTGTRRCRFIKLSEPGVDHPSVRDETSFWHSQEVLSVWSIGIHGTMLVMWIHISRTVYKLVTFEWKTGTVRVVKDSPWKGSPFHILNRSHILLHDSEGWLEVCSLDGSRPDCSYDLPTHKFRWRFTDFSVTSCIQPLDHHLTHRTSFCSDPTSTIVTLHSCYTKRYPPYYSEEYLILVPSNSLLTDLSSQDVDWYKWGPEGSRILLFEQWPCSISTFGSRCAVAFTRLDKDRGSVYVDVFLFDTVPSAKSHEHCCEDTLFKSYFDASDWLYRPGCIRTESFLPFWTMHKRVCYDTDIVEGKVTVVLTDDSLTVARYMQKEGRNRVHSFSV